VLKPESGRHFTGDIQWDTWNNHAASMPEGNYVAGRVNPSVVNTDMGKPLFKASDGGRFEILWEREDLTQSELQQGQKLPRSSMRWFVQKPFRPAYPCPCGQIFIQYLG
jgi:hypothetical protein